MDTKARVKEHWEIAKTIVPADRIIGIFLIGSQNYNMDSEKSDVDTKCLIVPSLDEIAAGKQPLTYEYHTSENEHITFIDIRNFIKYLYKPNPNDLEVFFTKYRIINPSFAGLWYELWRHREEIAYFRPHYTLNAMRHMANREFKVMEKNGFTTKGLALIFRLDALVCDYLLCKTFESALVPEQSEFFRKVKYGEYVTEEAEIEHFARRSIECINRVVDRYCEKSEDTFNDNVDAFLQKVRKEFIALQLEWEIQEYRIEKGEELE